MRATFSSGAALVAAAAAVLAACPEHTYPGTQIVTFSLTATPAGLGLEACRDAGYTEIPGADAGFAFTFSAIFSGTEEGLIQYMTIQDFVRDATFDGTVLSSPYSAPRAFSLCGDAGVDEELYVLPISLTQSQALSGECPQDPLRPGAIPLNPDAGIHPPGWSVDHFEAVRACGRLRDTIHPAGEKDCPVCTMEFDITGPRL
jgi:hypothetical protein